MAGWGRFQLTLAGALLVTCYAADPAADRCRPCHPGEASRFENSPMGRSVGVPSIVVAARLIHKASGSVASARWQGAVLKHRVERHGVSAEYAVPYAVGAGIVGYSYVVRVGRYLFQSPLSYYTQTRNWDFTPGYETETHLDFTHEIASACLFCHTGSVNLVAGTANQFAEPPFTAISCERCHGSAAAHLRNPVPGSIVNPANLAPRQRDSVCEQCHLEGNDRVLNPGRDWWDFRAGQPAETTFVTYLRQSDGSGLRAVSQSELLAKSQCARQSGGRLWCGTCHDPHSPVVDRAQEVRKACLSCHGGLFEARRHAPAGECVSCHMPRLRPANVSHAALTDHSIPRNPRPAQPASSGRDLELKAWREPAPALIDRDEGLAYFDLAAETHLLSAVRQAYAELSKLPASQMHDAPVEADLASVLLQQNQTRQSVQMYARAVAEEPANARYAYCLGAALDRAGNIGEAVKELRRSIQLDPSQLDPYMELAELYRKAGREAEYRSVIQEYLRFMPQNIWLRSAD